MRLIYTIIPMREREREWGDRCYGSFSDTKGGREHFCKRETHLWKTQSHYMKFITNQTGFWFGLVHFWDLRFQSRALVLKEKSIACLGTRQRGRQGEDVDGGAAELERLWGEEEEEEQRLSFESEGWLFLFFFQPTPWGSSKSLKPYVMKLNSVLAKYWECPFARNV